MRRKPRLLADQHDVCVRELPAGFAHPPPGLPQQLDRVGALEGRVAGGKERADVLHPGGTEDGIRERVRKHVAVAVPGHPPRVLDLHAAEHEGHTVLERVRVESGADAIVGHGRTSGNSSSERMRIASRGGSCRCPHGPRRT